MSKFSDKAKSVIASIAPTLGTALGGPFGGLAGGILAKALGGESSVQAEETSGIVEAASGETILKVREAELLFKAEMKRLDISEDQLVYADIADARKRDSALGGDRMTKLLAFMVLGSFIAMAFSVLFKLTVAESTLAGTIIGYMSAKAEQVIAFYFGSSRGSKDKTEALIQAMKR